MYEVEEEQDDLTAVDRHIAEGEDRVSEQIARIERLSRQGQDTGRAQDQLNMLQAALAQWREHRQGILDAVARRTSGH